MYGRNAMMVIDKRQRKNVRSAHSRSLECSCPVAAHAARARFKRSDDVQQAPHLIMFSLTKGQCGSRLFATSRAQRGESEPKS